MQNLTSNNNETRHVSIVLKNNNSANTDACCTLCGKTVTRATVDFVVEGTNDHVCHACVAANDDMMAEVCMTARESACFYYEHREGNAAVWRAALMLAKVKSHAVRDFHKYVDRERGMKLIPADVRAELAAGGLTTMEEIARAWCWPKEEPAPF